MSRVFVGSATKVIYKWEYPHVPTPCTSKNAVMVVATGDRGLAMFDKWGKTAEPYAKRIGADFIGVFGVSPNPEFPYLDKFVLHKLLLKYERVIHIDADIEVMPDAPDLFEMVPASCFGVCDERLYYMNDAISKGIERVVDIGNEYGFSFYPPSRYVSTSIIVASQQHSELFALPSIPFLRHPCYEQDLIHARLLNAKFPTIYFGPELQYIHGWGGHPKEHTKFHHYTGILK